DERAADAKAQHHELADAEVVHQAEMVVGVGVPRPVDLERARGLTAIGIAQIRRDDAILALEGLHRVEGMVRDAGDRRVQPAGGVLANRLTEDPGTKVLLIEAGGRDWNPLIHIPAGFFKMLDHDTLTWKFRAEPDPGTNGRAIVYTRGRVIGGSSSINGLIYI